MPNTDDINLKLGPVYMGCDPEPYRAAGVSRGLFPMLLCNLIYAPRIWPSIIDII